MVSADSIFFDLRPLTRTNDAYYSVDGLRWNFCQHVSMDSTDAVSQDMQFLESMALREDANDIIQPLTESSIFPNKVEVMYDDEDLD
jgi:hypothetical protein